MCVLHENSAMIILNVRYEKASRRMCCISYKISLEKDKKNDFLEHSSRTILFLNQEFDDGRYPLTGPYIRLFSILILFSNCSRTVLREEENVCNECHWNKSRKYQKVLSWFSNKVLEHANK